MVDGRFSGRLWRGGWREGWREEDWWVSRLGRSWCECSGWRALVVCDAERRKAKVTRRSGKITAMRELKSIRW